MNEPSVNCVLLADRHHGLTEGVRGLLETEFDTVVMVADENSRFESAARLMPTMAIVALLGLANGLAPWAVRNWRVFEDPTPVVSSAYLHL